MRLNALISAFRVHSALVPELFEHPFGDDQLKSGMRQPTNFQSRPLRTFAYLYAMPQIYAKAVSARAEDLEHPANQQFLRYWIRKRLA